MNGYDFDKTIFHGNSVRRFCIFCCIRLPYLWLLLPELLLAVILYGLKIIGKDAFLRMLEVFVLFVPCKKRFVNKFWDKNFKHVKSWYLQVKQPDDLVISASPAYLIEEICSRLGVACIASPCAANGLVCGKHCYGEEKVRYYKQRFGETPLQAFYSDSLSDLPMLQLAQRGYLVQGEKITLLLQNGEKAE